MSQKIDIGDEDNYLFYTQRRILSIAFVYPCSTMTLKLSRNKSSSHSKVVICWVSQLATWSNISSWIFIRLFTASCHGFSGLRLGFQQIRMASREVYYICKKNVSLCVRVRVYNDICIVVNIKLFNRINWFDKFSFYPVYIHF